MERALIDLVLALVALVFSLLALIDRRRYRLWTTAGLVTISFLAVSRTAAVLF